MTTSPEFLCRPRRIAAPMLRVADWQVCAGLDTVTERAAAPIIAKYTGVLAAADIEIFTTTTTFQIMQSLRLDTGPSGPVHP